MLGIYTFFVAYAPPSESVTLCDTAVVGTAYIRDEPLPETIEIISGNSITLIVPHVYPMDTIGNVLDIDFRLSVDSEFTSVLLTNSATDTEVIIDATGATPGTFTLKLESYD